MSSRLKISLALLAGTCGLILAGANLPVDTQLTIRTKLGKRTQPHWIVPADSKIVKTEGGSGLIRLFGGLLGCVGFATAMHLAGTDEREQTLFWQKQNVVSGINIKEHEACAEIYAGARLKKLQMEAQADVDYHSLQLQQKFRDAIGWRPVIQQPILPHGRPGTLDEITNPGDKVEAEVAPEISLNAHVDIVDNNVDTFGVSEIADNKPAITPGLLHPSETKARAILIQIALSRKSLLSIAGTGGGKSVTQSALISILKEKCPQVEFWVVSQKNDSFCGLKEQKRVTIFDTNEVKKSLDIIDHVWGIYNKRRHLDENKRKNLSPVRLVLADWFSINLALEKLSSHPDVKASNYLIKLPDIVLNGRDFNVCLWADLQSFNLDAIGMNADSNSRQNFNLIGLGNYYTNDEGVNDSYGVLAYMINSHHIISDKKIRVNLLNEFEQLRLISKRNERPIMFSTLEPPCVCLQADIRHYQQWHQIDLESKLETPLKDSNSINVKPETTRSQDKFSYLERLYSLEVDFTESETVSDEFQNVKQPHGSNSSNSDAVYFTALKLDRTGAIELVLKLKNEMKHTQTEIIWMLWNARPGKTKAYESALAEYKELTKEAGNNND